MGGATTAAATPAASAPVAAARAATAAVAPTGDARVALMKRRRRGRAGTIATSWRGVLTERAGHLRRKTLLGE